MLTLGFKDMPVRFFICEDDDEVTTIREVSEQDFLASPGTIAYERHSVFENGCKQICLAKRTK